MDTTVFLVRHGETDWDLAGRVLGNADVALNGTGIEQSHVLCRALKGIEIAEIVTSPLLRAVQTAEAIAHAAGIEVTRDPRLVDFPSGVWTGKYYKDLAVDPEYRRFVSDLANERMPGGERLVDVRERNVASLEQALSDNAEESTIVLVTHTGVIQVLLANYLGIPLVSYQLLQIWPGSISVLRFGATHHAPPRVVAVNLTPGLAFSSLC